MREDCSQEESAWTHRQRKGPSIHPRARADRSFTPRVRTSPPKGDRQEAIDAYERFLDYWRDADADLQPIFRSVRERVANLRRATG